ncbi:MAG: 50S ribosomal protein L1 [Candidatus Magasanikbacteria bacterium]
MSKRMKNLQTKVSKDKVYSLAEAVPLIRETSNVRFDASVEIHAKLGIDPKKGDQQIRSTITMPHGTGKTKIIAAFVGTNDEKAAKDAGADLVLGEQEIKKIKDTGKVDFEIAVATPEMMPKLAVAAKVLGPKGLMPNPKTDTVGPDVAKMIGELKKGKSSFKNDDGGNIHVTVGKVSFDDRRLIENIESFLDILKKSKPQTSKGIFIRSLHITSSMGPSVKLEVE